MFLQEFLCNKSDGPESVDGRLIIKATASADGDIQQGSVDNLYEEFVAVEAVLHNSIPLSVILSTNPDKSTKKTILDRHLLDNLLRRPDGSVRAISFEVSLVTIRKAPTILPPYGSSITNCCLGSLR
jgi:hypothetical protein